MERRAVPSSPTGRRHDDCHSVCHPATWVEPTVRDGASCSPGRLPRRRNLIASTLSQACRLRKVECGTVELEAMGAEAVATWVDHFAVPIEQAKEAVAKALWLDTRGDRTAASVVAHDAVKESDFFRSVISRLQQRTDS